MSSAASASICSRSVRFCSGVASESTFCSMRGRALPFESPSTTSPRNTVRSPMSIRVSTRQSSHANELRRIGLPVAAVPTSRPANLSTSRLDCRPNRQTKSDCDSSSKCTANAPEASINFQVACVLAMPAITRGISGTMDDGATNVATRPARSPSWAAVTIQTSRSTRSNRLATFLRSMEMVAVRRSGAAQFALQSNTLTWAHVSLFSAMNRRCVSLTW